MLAVTSLGVQLEVGRYFKTLGEPHSADPLAMWCGEGERKNFPLPDCMFHVSVFIAFLSVFFSPFLLDKKDHTPNRETSSGPKSGFSAYSRTKASKARGANSFLPDKNPNLQKFPDGFTA